MNSYGKGAGSGRARNSGCCSARLIEQVTMVTLRGMAMIALVSAFLVASAAVASAQTYSVLYSFSGAPDGADPQAPVTLDAATGNLYGTTTQGGSGSACVSGCGTVFELTSTGAESVLHSFTGNPDGIDPFDVFRDAKGNLFGTTVVGGAFSYYGTVFEINSKGVEKVLHSFKSGADGGYPTSGLIQGANTVDFYGDTAGGGTYDGGTIYKITASGSKTVLYSFGAKGTLGNTPESNLVQDGRTGNLYGLLAVGGPAGCGAVFELTPAGVETALHVFTGADGCEPGAGDPGLVMDAQENLFGTTSLGGIAGQGVVFELTSSGVEKVLYKFKGKKKGDGAQPYVGLVLDESTGNLYGTTVVGGTHDAGTVFKLSPPIKKNGRWVETVLYTFTGGADGLYPLAGLARDAQTGDLYGTAVGGGTYGWGVVFKLTP